MKDVLVSPLYLEDFFVIFSTAATLSGLNAVGSLGGHIILVFATLPSARDALGIETTVCVRCTHRFTDDCSSTAPATTIVYLIIPITSRNCSWPLSRTPFVSSLSHNIIVAQPTYEKR